MRVFIGGGWVNETNPVVNGFKLKFTDTYIPRGWDKYHLDSGYQDEPLKSRRITVSKFIKSHPIGVYVLSIDRHVTTLINGVIHDRMPIGGKCWVKGYTEVTRNIKFEFDIKPFKS